ncbi:hypothetical protein baBA2_000880 (plasmid) [Borrelia anserina]|uniref:Outer membrane lipoprotein-sorting protein n=2 Tax=Borrelia anserina TaxID=143 RepID=W5SQ49_BORAN|nr:hypothetical protein [Borrelia anserina]AHH09030.1 Hypothetical protein BAN_0900032 [Borrelia anserina BA2]APR65426.1 hypothetical protein N187_J02 [Borrelia anserina Es]UPA07255.1 hypothetical protein baBA2_000880 [Borrelia anserina]
MLKVFLVILNFCILNLLYAGNEKSLIKEFENLYYPELERGIYAFRMNFKINLKNSLEESVGLRIISTDNKDARLIYMSGANTDFAFLSVRNKGHFMLGRRAKIPIKVSTSYKVRGASELKDILGLNFNADFVLLRSGDNRLEFESKEKSIYPFVDLLKIDKNDFKTLHKDKELKVLKEVIYRKGNIKGTDAFVYFEIEDKAFKDAITKIYVEDIISTNLNNSIFSLKGFNRIFDVYSNYVN